MAALSLAVTPTFRWSGPEWVPLLGVAVCLIGCEVTLQIEGDRHLSTADMFICLF